MTGARTRLQARIAEGEAAIREVMDARHWEGVSDTGARFYRCTCARCRALVLVSVLARERLTRLKNILNTFEHNHRKHRTPQPLSREPDDDPEEHDPATAPLVDPA